MLEVMELFNVNAMDDGEKEDEAKGDRSFLVQGRLPK
jgi:hypothetical protein